MWRTHAGLVTGADDETVARIATLPSRLVDVDRALRRAVEGTGARATLVSTTALGLHTARLSGGDPGAQARAMDALRRDVLEQPRNLWDSVALPPAAPKEGRRKGTGESGNATVRRLDDVLARLERLEKAVSRIDRVKAMLSASETRRS